MMCIGLYNPDRLSEPTFLASDGNRFNPCPAMSGGNLFSLLQRLCFGHAFLTLTQLGIPRMLRQQQRSRQLRLRPRFHNNGSYNFFKQFEDWLRWRYSQPDLAGRFPNGF